jgi:hypothetical protein
VTATEDLRATCVSARVGKSAFPVRAFSGAITLGAVGAMSVDTARDPDLFWHVKTGQWIWAHHAVPKADPFSWTAPGRKWIAHEWLTEAVYASLHRSFGWVGIAVLSALIIVAGWMFVRATCLRLGAGPIAATGATLLAAISTLHTWGTRPQMISLMCTAMFAWLLVRAVTGDPRKLLFAVPVMLLWTNLHGGYIFGVAMLWAFTLSLLGESAVRRFTGGRRLLAWRTATDSHRSLLPVSLVAAVGTTAITLLNPNGLEGFTYPFSYLGKNASTKYVIEWFAPDFSKAQYWPFAIVAALFAAAVVKQRRSLPTHLLAIGVPFAFLAFQSVRNITQFAIIAAPPLGLLFTKRKPTTAAAGRTKVPQAEDRKASFIILAMIAAAVIAATAPTLTAAANERVQATEFPVAAARELKRQGYPNVFNQYDWGGYLMLAVPDLKVFIDGRPDMYGDAFVDRYMSTWWLKPGWKQRLDSDGVDTVIAASGASMIGELAKDPAWKRVYSDSVAVILRRR